MQALDQLFLTPALHHDEFLHSVIERKSHGPLLLLGHPIMPAHNMHLEHNKSNPFLEVLADCLAFPAGSHFINTFATWSAGTSE